MRSLRRRQMRYGLHSFTRRVWVSKGVRPVAPSQQRYEWGYLYGALGVGLARSEFLYAETVDQEHLATYYGQIASSAPPRSMCSFRTERASICPTAMHGCPTTCEC